MTAYQDGVTIGVGIVIILSCVTNITSKIHLNNATYKVILGIRNWQLETADWIWPVSSSVL